MIEPPAALARTSLEVFGLLIRDRRISHGAFRLWHCLRDYMNSAGRCFPGQRRIAKDIGCDIHSLQGWTRELISAKWLRTDQPKPGLGFTYTILDATGQPLRKGTTPTVGERHMGSVGERHNGPCGKGTTKLRSPLKLRGKPTSTAERIGTENQIKILKSRLSELQAETAEQWQRDQHPELLTKKKELTTKIKALEDSLL